MDEEETIQENENKSSEEANDEVIQRKKTNY